MCQLQLRCTALVALTASVTIGCGGSTSASSTVARAAPDPASPIGAPGCVQGVPAQVDGRVVAALHEGGDPDAPERRWVIDAYGVLELDGYESISAVVPPDGADGAGLAATLRSQIEDSGVLDLSEGCYGHPQRGASTRVVTLVVPHEGGVRRYALIGDDGPLALVRAIGLVEAYARAIALPYDEEARQAVASFRVPGR